MRCEIHPQILLKIPFYYVNPIGLGVRLTVYPFVPEGLAPYSKGYKHTNRTRRKQLSIPCVVLTSYALGCRIISSR